MGGPLNTTNSDASPAFLTKSDYAYQVLRQRIMSGELEPGSRLLLRTLAEDMGLSVMPIRDALKMMERDGLVTTANHRGATVTSIPREEVVEAVSIRMWLEILAIREATPLHTKASLAAVKKALPACERAAAKEEGLEFSKANRSLHEALEMPASQQVRALIGEVWDRLWQTRRQHSLFSMAPGNISQQQAQHVELVELVIARQADRAAEAMAAHRQSSLDAWAALEDAEFGLMA